MGKSKDPTEIFITDETHREVAKKLCPNAKVTLIDGRTDKNEWAIRMPMSAYNQFTESIPKCQKTMANTQR